MRVKWTKTPERIIGTPEIGDGKNMLEGVSATWFDQCCWDRLTWSMQRHVVRGGSHLDYQIWTFFPPLRVVEGAQWK